MGNLYDAALEEMSKETPNIKQVLVWLNESLELGDSNAAYALGTWYLHGENVDKDLSKAVDLLEIAANGNVPEACFDLAICYEKPEGVAQNLEKAFQLYIKAALYGDDQSFFEVGRCYCHGIGVEKNIFFIGYMDRQS